MKRPLLKILALCSVLFLAPAARASITTNENWNVALLDQILASVPPGATLAQIDDMQVSVSYLQSWRDYLAGGQDSKLAFSHSFTPWPSGNVYYQFDAGVSSTNQKVFLDCCAEWATFVNLHFIARTSQANYILVTNNPSLGGGLSVVGMGGGAQLLQIGPTAWNHTTVVHEIGHALGLVHEFQRSDRDNYVTINTNNMAGSEVFNFVLLTGTTNETPYDFLSVMHYSRTAFSTNGLDTLDPKPAYSQYLNVMGHPDPVLSASDRAGVIAMYGAGPGATNVVTNTVDSGPGSLRAALYYAHDHPGTTIRFNIPVTDSAYSNSVFNIFPSDQLTGIWGNTLVDGTTEPGYSGAPKILLNGLSCQTASEAYANGLQFRGTNSTARGFVINNFPNSGVLMDGSNTVGNTISGSYLGIDQTGTSAVTNGGYPAQISSGAVSNLIFGNVISGSVFEGVAVRDAGTSNNYVQGNYIGLNAAGTAALPNGYSGVEIFNGAQNNLIGGYTASTRNIISGNTLQGIYIADPATSNNIVAGNYIGLNAAGTGAISNGWSGVEIGNSAQFNVIGSSNVISGNGQNGVIFNGTANNRVQGNYIGLNPAGTAAVPNGWAGVDFYLGAQTDLAVSNVISGNGNDGVLFFETGVSSNSVQGNYIGLNAAGTAPVGNTWAGVDFYFGAQNNLIGGNTPAARNVISGNGHDGVVLGGSTTTGNTVAGNYIGLNPAGMAAMSNAWSGVEIFSGGASNLIGGYGGARNFISGNGNYGISINNGSSNNIVQGNTLGLNGTNGASIPNTYDNIICFSGSPGNIIGGTTLGAANIIAYSKMYFGVRINDTGCSNDPVRGNSIFGNNFGGISLNGAGNHLIAAPTLATVIVTTNTVISGNYNGANGTVYQFDFYSDTVASGSEAMVYLGSGSFIGTGALLNFTNTLGALVPSGRYVTVTATDPAGNTSAFSTGSLARMISAPNDGIPDVWRLYYFGSTTTNSQSAWFADPDHDGMNNLQEFLAGTNPTNAASSFKVIAENPIKTTNAVALTSANGIVYRVQYSDDLLSGIWNILADQVIGTGTNIYFPDPAASSLTKRFYRAEVLW